jgi:hypothetical protein
MGRRAAGHRTPAADLCQAWVIEPPGVVNTADAGGGLTVSGEAWL